MPCCLGVGPWGGPILCHVKEVDTPVPDHAFVSCAGRAAHVDVRASDKGFTQGKIKRKNPYSDSYPIPENDSMISIWRRRTSLITVSHRNVTVTICHRHTRDPKARSAPLGSVQLAVQNPIKRRLKNEYFGVLASQRRSTIHANPRTVL